MPVDLAGFHFFIEKELIIDVPRNFRPQTLDPCHQSLFTLPEPLP
jgi:hypothetical protein